MLLSTSPGRRTHRSGRGGRHGRGQQRRASFPMLSAARRWGRSRPLVGGLLVLVAGLAIVFLPGARLTVVLLPGLAGVSGFLFGAGLCVLGLFLWFQPRSHAFAGVTAILIALASMVTTNLGGFGVGVLLGILGGALGFAWTPDPPPRRASAPAAGPGGEPAARTDVLPVARPQRTHSPPGPERDT